MRKTPVRTLHLIHCDDCKSPFMGFSPAVFCPSCARRRNRANQKRRRIQAVTNDPNFYRKQNAYKNDWRHERIKAKGPIRCTVCGKAMERIRGRRETAALCKQDRTLARHFNNQVARVAKMRALGPHRCIDCGAPVARIKGLQAKDARCAPCKRERHNQNHRDRRARERERFAPIQIAV